MKINKGIVTVLGSVLVQLSIGRFSAIYLAIVAEFYGVKHFICF